MELKRRYLFSFVLILNFLLISSTVALLFLSKMINEKWIFSLYVSFLTISYHFIMRLCVGVSVDFAIKKFSVRFRSYIPVSRLEIKFYKIIRVFYKQFYQVICNKSRFTRFFRDGWKKSFVNSYYFLQDFVFASIFFEISPGFNFF